MERHKKEVFPRCMGRMIDAFDLAGGFTRTKMLTEKSHYDDPPICRNWSAAEKSPRTAFEVRTDNGQMKNEEKSDSSRRSRTPVKMLIAHEMSENMKNNKTMPNVVARLMGLEALPNQHPVLATDIHYEDYFLSKSAKSFKEFQQQEDSCLHNVMPHDIDSCIPEEDYKVVYEVNQQSARSERKSTCNNSYEKQLAFIRQKFAEAKHLASNEKLLKSKEFDDALDVLSSNRDMFLKILEEPKSELSGNLNNLHETSSPSPKQRIIVLKPSKRAEWKSNKGVKKREFSVGSEKEQGLNISRWDSCFIQPKAEKSPHPISIVVLKPSPQKQLNVKSLVSSPDFSLKLAEEKIYNRTMESRDAGSEIRKNAEESLCRQRSSQTQFSNEYDANRSSICKSDSEEEVDCFSNSGDISPPSDHCFSYMKRVYSQEPSMMKEAKKRLSERLAVVSTGGVNQQPEIQDLRSISTLAQMLSDSKMRSEERNNAAPNSWVTSSKNMQVSNSASKSINFGAKASEFPTGPSVALEDITKRLKSTVKGKLSILFSSKNRTAREKSITSSSMNSTGKLITEPIDKMSWDLQTSCPEHLKEEASLATSGIGFGKDTSLSLYLDNRSKEQISTEAINLPKRSKTSNGLSINQDQPSPISVLDAPFKDDLVSCNSSNAAFSQSLSRSPPIESIVRSLSWNNFQSNTFFPNYLEKSWTKADEEQENFDLVQKLLSFAGFENEICSSVLIRWHSLEIPLNSMLASGFQNSGSDRSRRRESHNNLIFDSVNEALVHIGNLTFLDLHPWLGSPWNQSKDKYCTKLVKEAVFEVLRDWNWVSCNTKNTSQIVDSLLKPELVGKKWVELSRLNMDGFSKEISESLLDDLIQNSLSDLIAD